MNVLVYMEKGFLVDTYYIWLGNRTVCGKSGVSIFLNLLFIMNVGISYKFPSLLREGSSTIYYEFAILYFLVYITLNKHLDITKVNDQ